MKPVLPLLLLFAAPLTVAAVVPAPQTPSESAAPASSPANKAQPRFDVKVRNDFFAGFGGDAKLLERGLATCEAMLKENPEHAEALVWHGAGTLFKAGQMFQAGEFEKGFSMWQKANEEMDKAVKLAPDNIGVRVARATALIPASRRAPAPQQRALLVRAREDMEAVYKVQQPQLSKLSEHSRGELLMALAEVYKRAGENDKAQTILEQVISTCASSPYAEEAGRWLKPASPSAKFEHVCIGCHTGK